MRRLRTVRRFFPTTARLAVMGCLVLVAVVAASARSAEPERSPSRYIPAGGLVGYFEYEGLDAHARAWEAAAAHEMLVKTPAGAMLTDLLKQSIEGGLAQDFGGLLKASDVFAVVDVFAHHGLAFACYDDMDEGVLVLRNVERPGNRARLEGPRETLETSLALFFEVKFVSSRIRGRTVYQIPEPPDEKKQAALGLVGGALVTAKLPDTRISAWREGDDWIIVIDQIGRVISEKKLPAGPHPDLLARVLDSIEGKQPDVTTHPGFISALAEGKDLKGFEPNGLFFLEQKHGTVGSMVFLEVVATAAELVVLAAVEIFGTVVSGLDDPNPGPKSVTGRPAKKDDQLELASRTSPKDLTPTDASKGGHPSKKDERAAGPPPESQPQGRPASQAGSKKTADAARDHPGAIDAADDLVPLDIKLSKGFGLDGFKRIVGRWGFQGRALLTDIRVEIPSPRRGVPALLDQPAFRKDRLPTIPTEAKDFVLASFEPDLCYQKILEMANELEPVFAEDLAVLEQMVKAQIGLLVREDLLRHVGPTWALVDVPDRASPTRHDGKTRRKHTVLVATVDDTDAFEKAVDSLASRIDGSLREYEESQRKKAPKSKEIGTFGMKRLPATDRGYRVDLPGFLFDYFREDFLTLNPGKNKGISLFLLIGKSSIAVASDLDRGRGVLRAGEPISGGWKPSGELANAIEGLPENLTFLSVSDPELCALPDWIAGLPGTIRYLVIGATVAQDLKDKTCWALLNFMGVPRPGQFWPRVERARTPKADDLRRCVFPSVLASAVDDRGYRIIHRQPFPFAGLASEISFYHRWSFKWKGFARPEMKYFFGAVSSRAGF